MNKTLTGKNLLLVIILLGILLIIPLTLLLLGQRQELRKKAGEFPPTVVFVPRLVKPATNEEFTLTLLLQGAGLRFQRMDGADIIFSYPNEYLDLVTGTDNKPITPNPTLDSKNLLVFKNEVSGTNKIVFSLQTKLASGKRLPYVPQITGGRAEDLVLGTVKFRAKDRIVNTKIEFDNSTVIAGGAINTTNFDDSNVDKRIALIQVQVPTVSLLRIYPSRAEKNYAQFPIYLTGTGLEATQKVKIGGLTSEYVDCGNITLVGSGVLSCNVPAGLIPGYYNIKILDSQNRDLLIKEKMLTIYDPSLNNSILKLKLRFSAVTQALTASEKQKINQLGLDYDHQYVKVKIIGNGKEFEKDNVLLTSVPEVVGDQTVGFTFETIVNTALGTADKDKADDRLTLIGFAPGTYDVFVKGTKHLQKKFQINLTPGEKVLDRSSAPQTFLPGGDLPLTNGQDGKVNSIDWQFIINNLGKTTKAELVIGDINLDGEVSRGDMDDLAKTLGEQLDEDE